MNEQIETNLIKIPIHQSLTEPVMIAGAERELAIMLAFMAVSVWLAGKDLISFFLSLGIWFVGIFFARLAAQIDPQLIRTLIRYFQFHQDFYPATEKLDTGN